MASSGETVLVLRNRSSYFAKTSQIAPVEIATPGVGALSESPDFLDFLQRIRTGDEDVDDLKRWPDKS